MSISEIQEKSGCLWIYSLVIADDAIQEPGNGQKLVEVEDRGKRSDLIDGNQSQQSTVG